MNKTDIINKVAEKTKTTKKVATEAVDGVFECIEEALRNGEKATIVGFGTFEVRDRAARKGVNPSTKAEIQIPATRVPAFKPGKTLKDMIAGKS